MSKKVLILGAGYAGIEAALTLQKKKKKADNIEISIIDKNTYHTLLTELHEVAGNRISEDGIIVPLKEIFKYTDVKLIKDEINSIDFDRKKLVSDSSEYSYDYLVLAAGSEPNYYDIPGMKENSFSLWSFNDAVRIREHIKTTFYNAATERDSAKRRAMLTFVVGGGGFTGVEMVGELALWIKSLCAEHDIPRSEVRLILIEAMPKILPILKDSNINRSMAYLTKQLKVEVMTNSAITRLTEDAVEMQSGAAIPTKTLIWTAGVRASSLSDVIEHHKGRTHRIHVDEYAQTKYPGVYAIGDISAFTSDGHALPALVEAALQTGKGAAKNIIADVRGKEKETIKPKLHGVMVSIGSFFAVSDIMGRQLPRFLSILMKYMVNIHYLFGIGGFELILKYLRHELIDKRQQKMLVEKHYTVSSQTFWLVPLRLFLGYAWLKEGIAKVAEGWLATPMLAGMATDANTSASATETGEKVFRIISAHTPDWYAWIAQNLVIPNALFFQIMIVLTEIGLGLAFISGTFTFLAGLASLGLCANFLLSTGLFETSWWFIPAAICMLGGAGRAFGVDHYLMPYLMRQWRFFVRNKRIKLFLFK